MRIRSWHFIVLIIFLLFYIHCAHGIPAGPKKPQQSIFELENSKVYVLGFIEDASVYDMPTKTLHTRIRMLPYGMLPMFDRTFDFCGDRSGAFTGKGTFVVIAYDRVVHGDDCNDLFGVFQAVRPTLNPQVWMQ